MSVSLPPSAAAFEPVPSGPLHAIACPLCFGALAVTADLLGQPAECPVCGGGFRVPVPAVDAAPRLPPTATAAGRQSAADHEPRPDRSRRGPRPESRPPDPIDRPSPPFSAPSQDDSPAIAAPTPMQFAEPAATVASGDTGIPLRRLSPEERAARRARRNLLMMITGISILLSIVLLLGTKPTKRRP